MFDYSIRTKSKIVNFLLSHRKLRTHIPKGTKKGNQFEENEQELAETLLVAPYDFTNDIHEYLAETGFNLISVESSSMPGLPTGSTYFLLIRSPEENVPEWLDIKHVYQHLGLKEKEAKATIRIWFFFIWTNILVQLYTSKSRPITNVSGYGASNFSKEILVSQIKKTIDEVRQKNPSKINQILIAEEGLDVHRRVTKALDYLISIGYLELETEGDNKYYCQSLLMALELKENYSTGLGYRFAENSEVMTNLEEQFNEEESTDLEVE